MSISRTPTNTTEYDTIIHLALLGDPGVGKSALTKNWAKQNFSENYLPTLMVDVEEITLEYQHIQCRIVIHNLSGNLEDQQHFVREKIYGLADTFVFVTSADQTDIQQNISDWENHVLTLQPNIKSQATKHLVVNKIDLVNQLSLDDASRLADFHKNNKASVFFTSAKHCDASEVFIQIIHNHINKSKLLSHVLPPFTRYIRAAGVFSHHLPRAKFLVKTLLNCDTDSAKRLIDLQINLLSNSDFQPAHDDEECFKKVVDAEDWERYCKTIKTPNKNAFFSLLLKAKHDLIEPEATIEKQSSPKPL